MSKCQKNVQNWLLCIICQLSKKLKSWSMDDTDNFNCSGLCVNGDISTNHKSSNRIELSQLGQDLFNF